MKRNWIIVALIVLVLVAIFLGPPVERVLNDPPPAAEQMAGTTVIDQPLAAPLPRPLPSAAVALARPLSPRLVIREAVNVRVPEGSVRLLRGLPVDLVQDRGDHVDVKFGDPRKPVLVAVKRRAVTARELPPEAPPPIAPVAAVRKSFGGIVQAPATSLSLEAREIGPGRGIARSYGAGAEPVRADAETFQTKGLNVTVHNYSRRPTGDCEVVVCWVGRTLAGERRQIGHAESFQVALEPAAEHKAASWCQLLEARDGKSAAPGPRFASGNKYDGWLAIVTRQGRVLTGRGSSAAYNDEILRDPAQLDPLLATWAAAK